MTLSFPGGQVDTSRFPWRARRLEQVTEALRRTRSPVARGRLRALQRRLVVGAGRVVR